MNIASIVMMINVAGRIIVTVAATMVNEYWRSRMIEQDCCKGISNFWEYVKHLEEHHGYSKEAAQFLALAFQGTLVARAA